MTAWEIVGLVILLLAAGLIAPGILLFDWFLVLTGRKTISERQWIALRVWRKGEGPFPWLVVVLPVGMLFGPVGLLIHFLT